MMEEGLYHLWFSAFVKLPKGIKTALLDYYGSMEALWLAPERELSDIAGKEMAEQVVAGREEDRIYEYGSRLAAGGISYVYPEHPDYPLSLMNIPDRPEILYVKGDIRPLDKTDTKRLAIVGARKATAYGIHAVNQIIDGLAGYDIQIISGLAYGIDINAHKAALSHGMYTAAILGCGVDIVYPASHAGTYREMEMHGALISEYLPGSNPENWHFPLRNRIISGLADAVLVVEAKEKSGSLITADQALEQGREVYAVPGRINDANSRGTNNLIKQGAAAVTCAADILSAFGMCDATGGNGGQMKLCDFSQAQITLAPEEKKVYSCVRLEPGHIDDICRASGLGVSDTLRILCGLKIKGLIYEPVANIFSRK